MSGDAKKLAEDFDDFVKRADNVFEQFAKDDDEYNAFCRAEYEKARAAMNDTGDDGWWGREGPTAVEALIEERDSLLTRCQKAEQTLCYGREGVRYLAESFVRFLDSTEKKP